MTCLTCGTTSSMKGKWNNLPAQGNKTNHPIATPRLSDSVTYQDVIGILKEPSFIYEYANKVKEGDLFVLAVKALESLGAKDELLKLVPNDIVIPPALGVEAIVKVLLGEDEKDVAKIEEMATGSRIGKDVIFYDKEGELPLYDKEQQVGILPNDKEEESIDTVEVVNDKTGEATEYKKAIDGTIQGDKKESESIITIESLTANYPTKETFRPYATSLGYPKFKARKLEKMYVELIEFLESV